MSTIAHQPPASVLDALLDVVAQHFKVSRESLSMSTRFGKGPNALVADEYDLEEVRVEYEDRYGALVHESFDEAKSIGDLFQIAAKFTEKTLWN